MTPTLDLLLSAASRGNSFLPWGFLHGYGFVQVHEKLLLSIDCPVFVPRFFFVVQ